MLESRAFVDLPDVWPLFGHAVDGRNRQRPVGIPTANAPSLELREAGPGELVSDWRGVRPAWHRRPAQQPADLARVAATLVDPVVRAVPQQMRCSDDSLPLLGDERDPLDHPWVDDGLARIATEAVHHRRNGQGDAQDHSCDMRVHERGDLLSIAAAERPPRRRPPDQCPSGHLAAPTRFARGRCACKCLSRPDAARQPTSAASARRTAELTISSQGIRQRTTVTRS